MKKYLALILVLVMSLSLVACGGGEEAAQSDDESGEEAVQAYWNANDVEGSIRSAFEASDGKIAIITNTVSQNEEEYRSAEFMVEKYGVERVIHATMPDNFMTEQEQFVSIVNQYASDPDVKCIIINQAVPAPMLPSTRCLRAVMLTTCWLFTAPRRRVLTILLPAPTLSCLWMRSTRAL